MLVRILIRFVGITMLYRHLSFFQIAAGTLCAGNCENLLWLVPFRFSCVLTVLANWGRIVARFYYVVKVCYAFVFPTKKSVRRLCDVTYR